ncbi:MAG: AI-2E family transporter [Oscillospiraceae bacterium]|nr:AI-2E family transporter [Oscillospiraceae bacterium]
MEISKKTLQRIFWGVTGCIVLYWLLHETASIRQFLSGLLGLFSPFLAGAAMAFALNVPMRAIERHLGKIKRPGLRRTVAIILTLMIVVVVLWLMLVLLIPQLDETVRSLIASLPAFWKRVEELVTGFLQDHPELGEFLAEYTDFESFDWTGVVTKVAGLLEAGVTSVVNSALTFISGLINGVINAVISLVFAIYALARKETLAHQMRMLLYGWLPEHWADRILRVARLTNSTFSSFISGQCVEACIFGSLVAITMLIFRMPFVPLVGVLAAVTALIPMVGAIIGWLLGALFILVRSPMQALLYLILYQVVQQIENNLIYPRVVGSSIGLPSMWVLVSVTVGGALMGAPGMLLMIPTASVVFSILRELTENKLAENNTPEEKLMAQPPEELHANRKAPSGIWKTLRNPRWKTTSKAKGKKPKKKG